MVKIKSSGILVSLKYNKQAKIKKKPNVITLRFCVAWKQ